jgi:hypothetical protein
VQIGEEKRACGHIGILACCIVHWDSARNFEKGRRLRAHLSVVRCQ